MADDLLTEGLARIEPQIVGGKFLCNLKAAWAFIIEGWVHSGKRALPEGDLVALLTILLTLVFVSQVGKQHYRILSTGVYSKIECLIHKVHLTFQDIPKMAEAIASQSFILGMFYRNNGFWERFRQRFGGWLSQKSASISAAKAWRRFVLASIIWNLPAGILAQTLPLHRFFLQPDLPSQTDLAVIFVYVSQRLRAHPFFVKSSEATLRHPLSKADSTSELASLAHLMHLTDSYSQVKISLWLSNR